MNILLAMYTEGSGPVAVPEWDGIFVVRGEGYKLGLGVFCGGKVSGDNPPFVRTLSG